MIVHKCRDKCYPFYSTFHNDNSQNFNILPRDVRKIWRSSRESSVQAYSQGPETPTVLAEIEVFLVLNFRDCLENSQNLVIQTESNMK